MTANDKNKKIKKNKIKKQTNKVISVLTSCVPFPAVYSQTLPLVLLPAVGSGSWQYPVTSAAPPPFLGPGQGPGGSTDPTETHHRSPDQHQSLHSIAHMGRNYFDYCPMTCCPDTQSQLKHKYLKNKLYVCLNEMKVSSQLL